MTLHLILLGVLTPLVTLGTLAAGVQETNDVGTSLELQCPSCDKIHCTPRRAHKLRCKGGITRGVCNCCPVCAKVQGQPCGGIWNYLGKCDRGLVCTPRPDQLSAKPHLAEGTCHFVAGVQSDEGHPTYCYPKCTPDYCHKNPSAICSAIDNGERKQECQGVCQHTSCLACRVTDNQPNCIKCSKDDFHCMRRYAKCIRKDYCSRHKFPCKKYTSNVNKNDMKNGRFVCSVADCLSP